MVPTIPRRSFERRCSGYGVGFASRNLLLRLVIGCGCADRTLRKNCLDLADDIVTLDCNLSDDFAQWLPSLVVIMRVRPCNTQRFGVEGKINFVLVLGVVLAKQNRRSESFLLANNRKVSCSIPGFELAGLSGLDLNIHVKLN